MTDARYVARCNTGVSPPTVDVQYIQAPPRPTPPDIAWLYLNGIRAGWQALYGFPVVFDRLGPGTYAIKIFTGSDSNVLVSESAPFTVPDTVAPPPAPVPAPTPAPTPPSAPAPAPAPETGALSGVPTTGTAGTALAAGGTFSLTNAPSSGTTAYVGLFNVTAGAYQGALQAVMGSSGSLPTLTPASAAGAATYAVRLCADSAGVTVLATSPNIAVVVATPAPAPTPTPVATAFTTALSSSSGTVGNAVTLTITPTGAAWPSSVVLTPAATGISGTFAPTTRTPSGTAATTFSFTPSAAGSGTISISASPSMTGPAGLAYQATEAATPTPTPAPAPTSDGTLTGLPSTIVAGQPLSAVTFSTSSASAAGRFVLWRVATGAEEGQRWSNTVLPGGSLSLLVPQISGAYTVRVYSYNGTSLMYESAQFTATAAPGALPSVPTQTADTDAVSGGVTTNWTATAPSYHVLARNNVGAVYGSWADVTGSAASFVFTGLPANSSARLVVIPLNANGFGTPSAQFISLPGA